MKFVDKINMFSIKSIAFFILLFQTSGITSKLRIRIKNKWPKKTMFKKSSYDWFSDIFWWYKKATMGSNGLKITA